MSTSPENLVICLGPESIDTIPLGILRAAKDRRLTYVNRAAQELIGPDIGLGDRLEELEFAPESEGVVEANLEQRFLTQSATTYPLTYIRRDLGTRVHVQISGVPEYDAEGRLTGALAFVTDKTMEHANVAIHQAIDSASNPQGLLVQLDCAIREVIAFDAIIVNLVSADRTALRIFYERPDRTSNIRPAWRWWPMPAFVSADVDTLLIARPDDLDAMFSTSPYKELAQTDEATREWLKLRYRHMLRKPVMLDGSLVAIATLLRFQDRPFDTTEVARLDQLPIGETVNIALGLEHESELEFALQLISHLGSVAQNIAEVGRVLVEEIKAHFEWEHVSLFRVNYDNRTISIVHQAAEPGSSLPNDYSQSSDDGLLGSVVLSGRAVRLGDVHGCDAYLKSIDSTNSEMCLPIPGDRVRWILNVESTLASAFAAEEQAPVERLLGVAGLILDRTLALEFNKTVLECVADAVIQTTAQGNIQYVNPACAALLERTRDAIEGKHLSTLLSAADDTPTPLNLIGELMDVERLLPRVVNLGFEGAKQIPVLLSGNALPPQIGGKVFVASDLRYRQQVQRMDALQDVFRQVASESRVPLALTTSFLEELQQRLSDADALDLIDRALGQVRRADLPLERVVRLAAGGDGQELPLQPMALSDVAARLVAELPETQRRKVVLGASSGDSAVMAARAELDFCASSLFAFLLRMKAQRDYIEVLVRRESSGQVLELSLVDSLTKAKSDTRLEPKSENERDFALAEPVIQSLMRRMRGRFELSQRNGLCLRLVLEPAVIS